MLYNPSWEKKIETDPYSLGSLIAWLEQQPADGTYDWTHPKYCLLGQFLGATTEMRQHEIGRKSTELGGTEPIGPVALTPPYTFGAALERARVAEFAGNEP